MNVQLAWKHHGKIPHVLREDFHNAWGGRAYCRTMLPLQEWMQLDLEDLPEHTCSRCLYLLFAIYDDESEGVHDLAH